MKEAAEPAAVLETVTPIVAAFPPSTVAFAPSVVRPSASSIPSLYQATVSLPPAIADATSLSTTVMSAEA